MKNISSSKVGWSYCTAHLLEWFSRSCWRTATSYHGKASAPLTCSVTWWMFFLSSHWYFSAFIRIPTPLRAILWNMHTMISSPKLCSSHSFYSVDFILISLSSTAKRFCTSPITVTRELWILSYCVVVTAVNTFALNVTDLPASGQCWSQSWINGRVVPGKGSGVKSVPKQIWGFILCGDRTGADTHAIILLLHLYKQVCCFPACCRTMSIKYRCIFPYNPSLAFFLLLSL